MIPVSYTHLDVYKRQGICYEGGLDAHGHPADTRTDFQKHSLRVLVMLLLRDYPGALSKDRSNIR